VHRVGDVLDLLPPQVVEVELEIELDLAEYVVRYADYTRLSQSFEPRGDVHAVAVEALALHPHLAKARPVYFRPLSRG
jgi:hypothetical protein